MNSSFNLVSVPSKKPTTFLDENSSATIPSIFKLALIDLATYSLIKEVNGTFDIKKHTDRKEIKRIFNS